MLSSSSSSGDFSSIHSEYVPNKSEKTSTTDSEFFSETNEEPPVDNNLIQLNNDFEYTRTGSSVIGICTNEGIVLVTENFHDFNELSQITPVRKILKVDPKICCAVQDITLDTNYLIWRARIACCSHSFIYFGKPISIKECAETVAYYAAEQLEDVDAADFTYKQYGDTMLLAGIDTEKGAQLYHIDATNPCKLVNTISIGRRSKEAEQQLEALCRNRNLTLHEATAIAIRIAEETVRRTSSIQVGVLTEEEFRFYTVENSIICDL